MRETIEVGYQTFVSDGGEEFGAIREISPDGLVVYVENAGEFRVPLGAVEAVHSQKVIWSVTRDSTTRVLLERILAQEKERATDMHDLLVSHEGPLPPRDRE